MNYGSICSGIEAATMAWHPLGWNPKFFAEIDKFPSAVLKHHYPEIPNYGDFTKIERNERTAIDLLVGGTPCQDYSVAGLRAGMDGARGNLTLEFVRLLDRLRPRWFLWENVPGILSSNEGRDFGKFLGQLGELGYGFAYRILDAQFTGVPQRRRRVFVVGYFGDWRRAAAVLFERHSLSGNTPPRRKTGQRVAGTVKGGSGERGYPDPSDGNGGGLIEIAMMRESGQGYWVGDDVTGTLDANMGASGHANRVATIACPIATNSGELSFCLNAGGQTRYDSETETFIAIQYPQTQFGDVAGALTARHDSSPCSDRGMNVVAIQGAATRENLSSGPGGIGIRTDGQAFTLEARSEVQAVALFKGGQGAKARGIGFSENSAPTLPSESGGNSIPTLMQGMSVRRLTPLECERLQGFPDGFTLIPIRGKMAADGPRYKAIGNSMAVPVMKWIGERIQQVEDLKS